MTYSIIQVNTNNYDTVYECNDLDAQKRLLFTDTEHNTKNWDQIKITSSKTFPFDDIFSIRWNPFAFTDSDYVIWIDGSIAITGSVKSYIDEMIKSDADFATLKHPFRDNIKSEYYEWCRLRNYDKMQAFKWMAHMEENGWNPDNKGLYQVNICIFKNTPRVKEFGNAVIKELHTFNGEHVERLDQTVVTYLLKTKFKDLKIFELDEKMYQHKIPLLHHWNHPAR